MRISTKERFFLTQVFYFKVGFFQSENLVFSILCEETQQFDQ